MAVVINGTTGVTTPTGSFATTIGVGGATPANTGAGITFPATQSASSDANTLDDYEEGTFTPTFNGTGGNPTITYSSQNGNYIKIGRLCFVSINLAWSAASGGSGNLRVGNLPFEPDQSNNMRAVGSMPYSSGWTGITNGYGIEPHTNMVSAAGGTYLYWKGTDANLLTYAAPSNLSGTGNIQVALMYYTNA